MFFNSRTTFQLRASTAYSLNSNLPSLTFRHRVSNIFDVWPLCRLTSGVSSFSLEPSSANPVKSFPDNSLRNTGWKQDDDFSALCNQYQESPERYKEGRFRTLPVRSGYRHPTQHPVRMSVHEVESSSCMSLQKFLFIIKYRYTSTSDSDQLISSLLKVSLCRWVPYLIDVNFYYLRSISREGYVRYPVTVNLKWLLHFDQTVAL